jgi:hypothetical protein
MPPSQVTDATIFIAVHKLRVAEGAVVLSHLANKLGMSKAGLASRVDRLVEAGWLIQTPGVHGSLRCRGERIRLTGAIPRNGAR